MTEVIKNLSTLPNQTGFRFVGVTKAGNKIQCEVRLNPVGIHDVYSVADRSPCWFQLIGWSNATGEQP